MRRWSERIASAQQRAADDRRKRCKQRPDEKRDAIPRSKRRRLTHILRERARRA